MNIALYHVDAFTDKLFSGNPAAVCVLPAWISEEKLRLIAIENNLPVTAFIVDGDGHYAIRWITPDYELDLCGHGTLASSFIIFNYLEASRKEISFDSRAGVLKVTRDHEWMTLNFPVKAIEPSPLSQLLIEGLGIKPLELYQHHHERLLAVFENEDIVCDMKPNMAVLKNLDHRGIVVTAPSSSVDFVSRTFYPWKGISEDPVTGASHCVLVPYWAKRLGKINLQARQVSARGGEIKCEYHHDYILLSSRAVLYSQGTLFIEP